MIAWLERMHGRARRSRALELAVANVRILVGFAFLPAGLKKILGQPFTDPDKTGEFHDFLHAFHATGGFYRFVGVVQLTVAVLLMTQRHARWGALLALPVITAIMVFCWSTGVVPTAIVATLMWSATVALVAWDAQPGPLMRDRAAWAACGAAVLVLYVGACVAAGEVYRPRGGAEWGRPAFYALVVMPALPVITAILSARTARGGRDSPGP